MDKKYDSYNREERAICAHLFRLLHENLAQKEASPLGQFLQKLSFNELKFENIGIYCELAIIRDAYENIKPDTDSFMKQIIAQLIKKDATNNFSINEILRNIKKTSPHRIDRKKIDSHEENNEIYMAIQAVFHSKPDLAITIDNNLLVFEAKFTQSFDKKQFKRTENIANIWTEILYQDFGFAEKPACLVFKLGAEKNRRQGDTKYITWEDIFEIVKKTYPVEDRTYIAFETGVKLLKSIRKS